MRFRELMGRALAGRPLCGRELTTTDESTMPISAGGEGGSLSPPAYTPALDFSESRNSQYALMGLFW